MEVELNGVRVNTAARTLAALLDEQRFEAKTVATAINGDFVPLSLREASRLTEGDKIEVLAPMQGG
ncbi:MAG: sulfur carrier protein ThiS [Rhodobacteraceae bacterium]|nr:sulfur carrier protein ThiS [Paracoccaceae bacterium]